MDRIKLELHAHTWYSRGDKIKFDAVDKPEDIVLAAKKKGLDGIAIVDHNTQEGIKRAMKAGDRYNILVIPGMEISSRDGHIVALGIEEKIPRDMSAEETIELIHDQGGVATAAHPFDIESQGVGRLVRKLNFDCMEVFNSINVDKLANRMAMKVSKDLRITRVAGSDAHTRDMVGLSVNILDSDLDLDSVIDALRNDKVEIKTNYASVQQMVDWSVQRLKLSYPHVSGYIGENYSGPKRIMSKQLLSLVKMSPGKIDHVFTGLGHISLYAGSFYSGFRYISALMSNGYENEGL